MNSLKEVLSNTPTIPLADIDIVIYSDTDRQRYNTVPQLSKEIVRKDSL